MDYIADVNIQTQTRRLSDQISKIDKTEMY